MPNKSVFGSFLVFVKFAVFFVNKGMKMQLKRKAAKKDGDDTNEVFKNTGSSESVKNQAYKEDHPIRDYTR